MKSLLHYPVYEELKDKLLFKDAKVKYGTIVWNEEIDLDPADYIGKVKSDFCLFNS